MSCVAFCLARSQHVMGMALTSASVSCGVCITTEGTECRRVVGSTPLFGLPTTHLPALFCGLYELQRGDEALAQLLNSLCR